MGGAASRLDIPRVNTTHVQNAAATRSDFVIVVLLVKPVTGSFYSIPAYAVNVLHSAAMTSAVKGAHPQQVGLVEAAGSSTPELWNAQQTRSLLYKVET